MSRSMVANESFAHVLTAQHLALCKSFGLGVEETGYGGLDRLGMSVAKLECLQSETVS